MRKINQKSVAKSQKSQNLKSFILKSSPILALFLLNLIYASIAFCSSGEEGHTSLFWDYFWKIVNFGVLAAILVIFARKPLQSFFKQRTEMIAKTLKEAKEAKELAQKALQEAEERFKTKDKEIEEILSASKRSGEQEREKIIEESNRLKEKIFEQAKVNIEYELKHAKEAIKAEAVEIAMELAEKKIKDKLTKTDQEKLLEESLTKIGGKG
jgi:F-type H+-transporting ATPase subunit b